MARSLICSQRRAALNSSFFVSSAFLCPLTANTYGIEFLQFTVSRRPRTCSVRHAFPVLAYTCVYARHQISDYETKRLIFEVGGLSESSRFV